MNSPQNFYPKLVKNFACLRQGTSGTVAVMPLAAKVLKQVMVNTGGTKSGPAKRQNRGSRKNSATDDEAEKHQQKETHHGSSWH
uniref:single-stranded DNA-binding protein n=1 Tax=Escherichia coli TaxID=562 RepID=UPI003D4F3C86